MLRNQVKTKCASIRFYKLKSVKSNWVFKASVGFFFISFFLLHLSTLISLARDGINRDDSFHIFFIPFISLYFLWFNTKDHKTIPSRPSYLIGSIVLFIGLVGILAGEYGNISTLNQMALLITIPGSILILLGTDYLKVCLLPICYLVLMIPSITGIFISPLHFPSQILTATISADILNAIGIPVYRHAQFLELPKVTLEVANECSGIRYLVSILALGIPLAVLTQKSMKYRILVVTFAIIVGIAANSIRVILIGMWAHYGGVILHGPAEIFQGLFVAVMGYAFLFGLIWLSIKWQRLGRKNSIDDNKGLRSKKTIIEIDNNKVLENSAFSLGALKKSTENRWPSSTKLFVVGTIFIFCWLVILTRCPILQKFPIYMSEFPINFGNWKANHLIAGDQNIFQLNADDEIYRTYSNDVLECSLNLYIAYFEDQRIDRKLTHYTLESLYDTSHEFSFPNRDGNQITVNYGKLTIGKVEYEAIYWYIIGGDAVSSIYASKYLTILMNLFKRKSNGAFIAIYSKKAEQEKNGVLSRNLIEFVRDLFPQTEKWFLRN
jgi:EpsI family protein